MVRNVAVVGGGSAGLMAALALKSRCPQLSVRVIRSRDIGIIGVGEGSTVPLTTFLHGFLKADYRMLLKIAQPTWKLGLKFKWGPRPHFYYPFGPLMDFTPHQLSRNIAFYCEEDMEDATVEMSMMAQGKAFQRGRDGTPVLHPNIAYHIENEKFVEYLEAFASHLGIEFIEETIEEVKIGEAGVSGLALRSGRMEAADLYVDASGFISLLLGKALGEPFVSYKSSLLCDRAVVGGWDRTSEVVHPYTTSEQMSAGWCWQIEHVGRINRGYVYSSEFVSDADAELEFREKNPKVGATRVVKFVSGRYERGWVKNVVAIGNSSGFVEPLEATALSVIGTRSQLLAQILFDCDCDVPDYQIDLYNRHHARIWDSIRRFLACHYRFNPHPGTAFWQHCHREVDLAGCEEVVEYYQRYGPSGLWGAFQLDPLDVFGIHGYLTILVGQKVPHQRRYTPPAAEAATWQQMKQRNRETAARGMGVIESLRALGALPQQQAAAMAGRPQPVG